ncbi:MAG: hypothetical protein LBH59_02070 [Planctomycetaceae bacterium]|nr:hypothetical protein [Planctomycetaceae bacterium]
MFSFLILKRLQHSYCITSNTNIDIIVTEIKIFTTGFGERLDEFCVKVVLEKFIIEEFKDGS